MAGGSAKAEGALKTISEVAEQFNIPQHILRYWEQRFPQLRPLQRAGNRRYYRPEDVALVERINQLLNQEGYTVKGVQKLISSRSARLETPSSPPSPIVAAPPPLSVPSSGLLAELRGIREILARALAADQVQI